MEEKCTMCGAPMENGKCSYCGHTVQVQSQRIEDATQKQPQPQVITNTIPETNSGYKPRKVVEESPHSKVIAFILCFFLGYFGVHKFYVGKPDSGKLYLCTLGLLGMGWVLDMVLILLGTFKDGDGLPLKH